MARHGKPTGLVLVAVALGGIGLRGQTTTDAAPALRFEAASIKPNRSAGPERTGSGAQGERFAATAVPVRLLIQMAYNLDADRIVGGPGWIARDRFDVVARAGAPFSSADQWRSMLRTLLIERLHLQAHAATRDEPVYSLLVARRDGTLGDGLRRAATDCQTLRARAGQAGNRDPCGLLTLANALVTGRMRARGLTLASLLIVARDAGRPVHDKTGLTGAFDWELAWTPQTFLQGPFDRARFPTIDPDGPSIFTALREQLGLKLEPARGSVDVLVVDSVERPSED